MRIIANESNRFSKALVTLAFCLVLPLHAQQQPSPKQVAPLLSGSVVGTVYYETTHLPARFANIRLVPKPADEDTPPTLGSPTTNQQTAGTERRIARVNGATGMDGSFHLDGVPAGDYFIAALQPGCVPPGAAIAGDLMASDDQVKAVLAILPTVHVGLGQTATINLTLHRGAVISGRLQYPDGSPAAGTGVGYETIDSILLHPELRTRTITPLQSALQSLESVDNRQIRTVTDDEGRYRIFGVPPGKYVVSTVISLDHDPAHVSMSDGSNPYENERHHLFPEVIVVYGPGIFRRKDARVIEIVGDEQITDADIKIDMEGLRSVRGKVLAEQDRHPPNGVMIQLRDDGSKQLARFEDVDADGSFQISLVPSGKYTLVVNANDLNPPDTPGPMVTQSYETFRLPVIVGTEDVSVGDVLLSPLKPGERQPAIEF
jgi:hypothetical protein